MDKIKQIEAFVNAAEKGNLARASLVLGITPVMLGRRIDALERRPGIKLMHRTIRHLTLTERGTVFLDRCRRILDEPEQAEQMIGDGLNKVTNHLVVSALAAFGRKYVAPHAPAFLPAISIAMIANRTINQFYLERYGLIRHFFWEIQSELASSKPVTILDDSVPPNDDIMAVYRQ